MKMLKIVTVIVFLLCGALRTLAQQTEAANPKDKATVYIFSLANCPPATHNLKETTQQLAVLAHTKN